MTSFTEARLEIAKHTRIWPYWNTGGEPAVLLQTVQHDGAPGMTIGSCKLAHADEYVRLMMRGLEVGYMIAANNAPTPPPQLTCSLDDALQFVRDAHAQLPGQFALNINGARWLVG
jgi:hypothetical protein